MSRLREDINARRDVLLPLVIRDYDIVENLNEGANVRAVSQVRINELRQIEATLATFQLADRQAELVMAQERATNAQQAATSQLKIANDAAEVAKGTNEEVAFWSRRFITNLAIANGAAFVAVLSFMLKKDSPFVPFNDVFEALKAFGYGTTVAACYPLVRILELKSYVYIRKRQLEGLASIPKSFAKRIWSDYGGSIPIVLGSALLFGSGMVTVLGSAQGYYNAKPQISSSTASSAISAK